jgi:Raf kinase inhibitor-like YbhB/YbcL family protein
MKNVYLFVLVFLGVFLVIHTVYTPDPEKADVDQPKVPDIIVSSDAFDSGGVIPKKFSCEGENTPPPLAWKQIPGETKSFALLMEDPDVYGGKPWVHWLVYDMPAQRERLTEADYTMISTNPSYFGKVGLNTWGKNEYGGPCPPTGNAHRYIFTLYALDIEKLSVSTAVDKEEFLKAIKGHVLAQGSLMGTYMRQIPG